MENIKKILIIPAFILWFIINFSLAETDFSDCGIFASLSFNNGNWFDIVNWARETENNNRSNFLDIDQQKAIIWKSDLNVAMINLKKYCCEHELWWLEYQSKTCQDDKDFFNNNAPDSRYLFDHIFDVTMRRLSWLTWEHNVYPKMTEDNQATQWRARITKKAENLSGSDAQSIINEYTTHWKQSPSKYNITNEIYWKFQDSYENFLTYVSWKWESKNNDSTAWKKVAEALKQYNQRTLYDKYINACAITEYFYSLLAIPTWKYTDRDRILKRLANWSCDKIVATQIDWENTYVQLIVQRSSNLFLSNYVEWYMWYLYDRETKLKNLRKNSTDRFLDVVRAIPHLVKKCVK